MMTNENGEPSTMGIERNSSAREVGVLAHDLGIERVCGQEHDGARPRCPGGKLRPAEAEPEAGNYECCNEHERRERQHGFLLRFAFLGVKPLAQQVGRFRHHDEPRNEHGHEEDTHEQPALPPVKRAGGEEQQQADGHDAGREFRKRSCEQPSIHRLPPCDAVSCRLPKGMRTSSF